MLKELFSVQICNKWISDLRLEKGTKLVKTIGYDGFYRVFDY